ncbi:hypothetical protein L6164_029622 [Bauhinia variegata]|uniref:Uncharacterized protein n=1 Tax=Bauhinia variegata TaxID=167791 RepID=A0ACB9L9W2_BAUVA|nr:hypothetical protein L6164_029622 [Bauhinia variegata]
MKGTCGGSKRSESDKEKTKLRERQRRAITANIFHGLRKHGGYRLSPRADINEVLRELAKEAGWIVEPDGTTYRSKVLNCCPLCGATKTSIDPTPTSSVVNGGGGSGGGGGGECSTTALPHGVCVGGPLASFSGGCSSLLCFREAFFAGNTISVPLYTYQGLAGEIQSSGGGNGGATGLAECSAMTYERQGQVAHLDGVNLQVQQSNHSTVAGSSMGRI